MIKWLQFNTYFSGFFVSLNAGAARERLIWGLKNKNNNYHK